MTDIIQTIALAVEECGPVGCCPIDERNAAAIAQAVLTAINEAGYAVVPREPSAAMIAAGSCGGDCPHAAEAYGNMIAAITTGETGHG